MNLLLIPSTLTYSNVGDLAMLVVAIKRFEALLPHCTLNVITEDPRTVSSISPRAVPCVVNPKKPADRAEQWLRSVRRALGPVELAAPRAVHRAIQAASCFRRNYAATERIHHFLRRCDGVVFSGGGFLTDAFSGSCMAAITLMERAVSLEKPLFLMGQGVGPFSSAALRDRLLAVLKYVKKAYLREPIESSILLFESGVDRSEYGVTGDDAIEIVRARGEKVPKREAVGINLRLAGYSGVGVREVRRLTHVLGRAGKELGLRWRPIPIVVGGVHDDYRGAGLIAAYSEAASRPHMVFEAISDWRGKPGRCLLCRFEESVYSCPFSSMSRGGSSSMVRRSERAGQTKVPSTCCTSSGLGRPGGILGHLDLAIEAAGGCRVVLAGSYHAAVFALSQGVPVVAVHASDYYQVKFTGLAAMFPGGLSLVDLRLNDAEERLCSSLNRAWVFQPSLARRLETRATSQVASSWRAYRSVAQHFEG